MPKPLILDELGRQIVSEIRKVICLVSNFTIDCLIIKLVVVFHNSFFLSMNLEALFILCGISKEQKYLIMMRMKQKALIPIWRVDYFILFWRKTKVIEVKEHDCGQQIVTLTLPPEQGADDFPSTEF